MDWHPHATELAATVTPRGSQWRRPVTTTPRHLFIPRWWETPAGARFGTWELHDGPADPGVWMRTAYSDQSLITRVGESHADHAAPDARPGGRPTSSATLPSLVVRMLRHAEIYDGADVLDVATGSGYSAALLAQRLGDDRVTSIDVDPYLVEAAAGRLESIGLRPDVLAVDATGPLPGTYDRIVSMVSVRPIPASWLVALRPGGRLVTVIANTSLIVTAAKADDGSAEGQIEWDRAMFMPTRSGGDYPPGARDLFDAVWDAEGDEVTQGRYPVLNVSYNWELPAMLEVVCPGIEHHYEEGDDGWRTARMVHADGSWARATAQADGPPVIHQGGPRRLWDVLDEARAYWLQHGELPVRGAFVCVAPDGVIHLQRGRWKATIG
ncbi:methyltransferase domain-containing protein [Streptosporangium minutum]|uniref:Protein-L-isoaspartate O-methyltransferase n=1 Tax=Streptosporangium minutum TaxID=569862 RepID=A0A243RVT8_9ACTN|nr:methyltransferase domain-containing protein [Streptosporangium minutum]OUC99304.1 protein-L-isoaspartate(D-aspartate) O-methyltransferase [Streptosporangium minutum]